nr:UvrD-helicase domain-containing protein [uncultured Acetatifactor sp.]
MKIPKKSPAFSQNENVLKLLDLKKYIDSLLASDKYIAKSDYLAPIKQYKPTIDFFDILKNSGMLADFCQRNGISLPEVQNTTAAYTEIEKRVDQLNEEFITKSLTTEKEYLDNILKSVDPAVSLDDDQRRVVLTDEDYCLVIAGAGAGKTTTVAAKVKYLVDRQGIKPSQILVVSFTNKAVNELKEKIQSALGIPCPIATFHSTGNAIIHVNAPEEKLNIVDNSRLYFVIRDYFRGSVMQNESIVNKLIMFFASYFDAPYEGDDFNAFFNNIAKANYSTMRSDLEDFKCQVIDARTKKSVTIQNEVLRSHQEVEIANFLYLNNIDYDYEPAYPYNIAYARKPYTPDFIICQDGRTAYIEHFGISQSGENDRYSPEELDCYKKAVNNKVRLHKQHGTTLIYTFSSYNDRKPLLAHLREELEAKGFELRPRSNKEVMESLVAGEENRYVRKLINLICRFISNFKVNGYTEDEFGRMYHSTQNVRSRLFLDICNDCYLEYARWLRENKAVDFEDMINESARILTEVKEMKQKLDFKYIIVDEYQDISRQRFDLTKALSEVTDAKIIAVGDDWQSIYAFSGSDITLFTKFAEKMGYAKMLKIVRTYRNSQEVIDIAGNFIQRNSQQIPKQLVSPKRIEDPVVIYTYDRTFKGRDGNRRSGANYALAAAVETAIGQLLEYKKKENKEPGPILFLGRFGFDGDHLERSGLFEYSSRGSKIKSVKYPKLDITFMTAHSSKGLGYDDVIIVNGKNETYGFPSKIEDDPVLAFVIKGDKSIDYAEERRLFYVAMTRTKNRVFFIAPEQNPSEFLLELKRDYKNVVLHGDWNEDEAASKPKKACPLCGYPMQLKYKKAYGLRLYICTNEPEVCSFMTNDVRGGKLSIQKCDKCRDGYMIVKQARDSGFLLGCTNYNRNGTGCNNVVNKKLFYDQMGYEMEEAEAVRTEKAAVFWKSPNQQTASTLSASQSAPQSTADRRLEDDSIEIVLADIPPVMYGNYELNHLIFAVVKALQNISRVRYYGATVLAEVLKGTDSKKIFDSKLDKLPEFGALRDMPYDTIKSVIDWMIAEHLILKTKGKYPVLHSTHEGLHYSEVMTEGKLKGLKKYLEGEAIV